MNKLTSKQQSGFTMIELVMVIVIMGVLAAVALPKFVDLKGSGQTAALAGVQGTINSASSVNYGQYYSTVPAGAKGVNLVGMTCSAAASALLQDGLPANYTISKSGAVSAATLAAAGTTDAATTAATAAANLATSILGTSGTSSTTGTSNTPGSMVTSTGGSGTAGALLTANNAVTNALNNTTGVTAASLAALRATAANALTANNAATAAASVSGADSMSVGDNICTLTGPSGATLPIHIAA